MKTKFTILVLAIFLSISFAMAQKQVANLPNPLKSETSVNIAREIDFKGDSRSEEILIPIEKQSKLFNIRIESIITGGSLTVEFYDPNDNKQGSISLGTQTNSSKTERVNGLINKSINEAMPGNWKVKILPKSSTGKIRIETILQQ